MNDCDGIEIDKSNSDDVKFDSEDEDILNELINKHYSELLLNNMNVIVNINGRN